MTLNEIGTPGSWMLLGKRRWSGVDPCSLKIIVAEWRRRSSQWKRKKYWWDLFERMAFQMPIEEIVLRRSDLACPVLLRILLSWDLRTDCIGHSKMEIIGNLDKDCFGKSHTRRLGSEKGRIRTIDDSYKNLCFKRIWRDKIRAGQETKGIYFVLFLWHIYVQMKIIQ